MSNKTIFIHRDLVCRTLSSALLREARENLKSLDEEWQRLVKVEAAYERAATYTTADKVAAHCLVESEARATEADLAFERYTKAMKAYDELRTAALKKAGADESIAASATEEDAQKYKKFEEILLARPPVGWGTVKYTSAEDRISGWQKLSKAERLQVKGQRI